MKKITLYRISNTGNIVCSVKPKPIFILNRSLPIIKEYTGLTFFIYNGKSFIETVISFDMIGHKFGEFAGTRKLHKYVKKKKKK